MFTVIFLLYGGIQLYDVARVKAGLALSWPGTAALLVWAALMTIMPLLVWRWERHGWHRGVAAGSWIGYGWMGISFLFFWISLAISLVGVLLPLAGLNSGLSARTGFLWACALTAVVAVYGFVDARRPRIERITLHTPKLKASSRPLRVALISDVHLGAMIGARRLRAILDQLRALDPDVLISAGDLVDGQADHLNGLAPMLADFRPRYGKFAVTGNHEYFVGLDRALAFHERAGFRMLRGTVAEIGDTVTIAGVDDPTGQRMGLPVSTDEHSLLQNSGPDRFTILIKHQPRLDPRAAGKFDLQVSGHVHKGQIFPFGLLVRLTYPVATGLTALAGGGWLYVSRGTGTWGPPIRVAASPEITLIEISPEAEGQTEQATANG
jgi:predicted MPP superfamily phosphohydrolase